MIRFQAAFNYRQSQKNLGLCVRGDKRILFTKTLCKICVAEMKMRAREYKTIIFNHYGYICQCCKIKYTIEFLTIDHINNDGAEQRRIKSNHRGIPIASLIGVQNAKKGIFPLDLQTLCWNCNCAKAHFDICPHQR